MSKHQPSRKNNPAGDGDAPTGYTSFLAVDGEFLAADGAFYVKS